MKTSDVILSARKKVRWRILPYLFIIYFVAFLDRSSITYASLGGMDKSLGLTATTYGFIAGIFFIGYFIFGIPGNMILEKVGARRWIGLILILWGLVTLVTAFVQSSFELAILRFLLGVFEAALFPGITLIVTYWVRSADRAAAVALFMIAPPLANSFGAPLATWVITQVHMFLNLDGWRWLFIVVGIPAVLLGFFTFWYLADKPDKAKWLDGDEKKALMDELYLDQKLTSQDNIVGAPMKEAVKNGRVWKMTFINVFYVVGLYGLTFWLPQMIKALSSNFSTMTTGWLTAVPYLLGAIALVLNSHHSDATHERIWHTACGAFVGGIGFMGAALSHNPWISMVFLCFAAIGIYAWSGPYWAITTMMDPRIAAIGLGIVNALGNLGGFVGPYVVGWLKDFTGSQVAAMFFLSGSLILAGLIVLTLRHSDDPVIKVEQEEI
ncbi:MFS transporter [Paucilactobacillus kaifaensis]|uniref:MFS transporter n=1 Tax=Paucilactobacillus kaifaensis TaxID=2559921 RepID=UPI0010F9E4B2|nr:MFS transporter [Paucilactobacillus kaifaensis]